MVFGYILLHILKLSIVCFALTQSSLSSKNPPFFLQDLNDGMCLAGSEYQKCSIDTLFFVNGKPGSYSIHQRPVNDINENLCFARLQCNTAESEIAITVPTTYSFQRRFM